jgi:hypothetical protein
MIVSRGSFRDKARISSSSGDPKVPAIISFECQHVSILYKISIMPVIPSPRSCALE